MNKIASVYKLNNIILENENSKTEFNKQNVLIIEDIKGKRIILDINSGIDITDTYMKVKLNKNSKMKLLFENEMFKNNLS